MFRKLEPLSKEQHQDLRFTAAPDYQFAAKSATAPLAFSEFAPASKYYPIVFLKETGMPVVILSLEKERNGFVNADGLWTVPYVPAHFRRYPFMLAQVEDPSEAEEKNASTEANNDEKKETKLVLCIDRDAPQFTQPQGELLFTANGEFTEFVVKQVDFLKQFHKELSITTMLVRQLQESGVLVDRSFIVTQNGVNQPIGGFMTVDMQRVSALDDALLADWVRRGVISLITSHINSLVGIPMGGGSQNA